MKKAGILTFHCADNCGAMLQAYGLKRYLKKKQIEVDIIDYEPFYMTGRHWWIPYIPAENILYSLAYGIFGCWNNMKRGKSFFKQRAKMKQFRKRYLIEEKQKKVYFRHQLKHLPYQYYIVGSDQIWNPKVTHGLRKVYFGDFKNKNKIKVIAYAASLGSSELAEQYNKTFSELIKNLDAISVRECAAISYIKQFYSGEILVVPDPVFLLKKEEWSEIEKLPDRKKYIIIYITENNDMLLEYAKEISTNCELSIIKIENGIKIADGNYEVDHTAGPSELLGYIHKADYVITNSFHVVAFSIIYHKKFMAFKHSSVGERIINVLKYYGLENRLYQKHANINIDDMIDWDNVEKKVEGSVRVAEEFLMRHIGR